VAGSTNTLYTLPALRRHRSTGVHMLVDISEQPIGNEILFRIDPCLLERELVDGAGVSAPASERGIESQVAPLADTDGELTRPFVERAGSRCWPAIVWQKECLQCRSQTAAGGVTWHARI